jgi:hypothetical protein
MSALYSKLRVGDMVLIGPSRKAPKLGKVVNRTKFFPPLIEVWIKGERKTRWFNSREGYSDLIAGARQSRDGKWQPL